MLIFYIVFDDDIKVINILFTYKQNEQNFVQNIFMPNKQVESPLQALVVRFLKEKGISQRKFAEAMDLGETTFSTYSKMSSAMGIDTLDKILSTYPEIRTEIAKYLGVNTEQSGKNITEVAKLEEVYEKLLASKESEISRMEDHLNTKGRENERLALINDNLLKSVNDLTASLTSVKKAKK